MKVFWEAFVGEVFQKASKYKVPGLPSNSNPDDVSDAFDFP